MISRHFLLVFVGVVVCLLARVEAIPAQKVPDVIRALDMAVSQSDEAMENIRALEAKSEPRFMSTEAPTEPAKSGEPLTSATGEPLLSSTGKPVVQPVPESATHENKCKEGEEKCTPIHFTNSDSTATAAPKSSATVHTQASGTQVVVGGTVTPVEKHEVQLTTHPETMEPSTVSPSIIHTAPADLHSTHLHTPVMNQAPIIEPLVPKPVEINTAPLDAVLGDAEAQLNTTGYVAEMLAEGRNPTNHLIQRIISRMKQIEKKDVGPVSPGDKLNYDYRLKLEGKQKVNGSESGPIPPLSGHERQVVASTLLKLGNVVDTMSRRIADLEKSEAMTIKRLTPPTSAAEAASDEEHLKILKENNNVIKENEIAALIRNEVRILTNQVNMRLRLLKENFNTEITEMLNDLRDRIGNEFVRSSEKDRELEMKLMKPGETLHLKETLLVKPILEKKRIEDKISQTINEAFSKSENIAEEIVKQNHLAKQQYEARKKLLEEKTHEPTHKMMQGVLKNAADAARDIENKKMMELQKIGAIESDARKVKDAALRTAKALADLTLHESKLHQKYAEVEAENREEVIGDEADLLAQSKEGADALKSNALEKKHREDQSQKLTILSTADGQPALSDEKLLKPEATAKESSEESSEEQSQEKAKTSS